MDDPSPLVVVFDDGWEYALGYVGGYPAPTDDAKASRRQVFRGESREVTGRGGNDYPLAVFPSRVRPESSETFWLDASLMIEARDLADAKRQLDEVLERWARESASKHEGLMMFDRTGLVEEENK